MTMNNFKELLEKDIQANFEYPDEKLISNLYYVSLSHSLKQVNAMNDISTQSEWISQNNWLSDECEQLKSTPIINFDALPHLCGCDNLSSCDGFFYDYNDKKFSLLVELKNCDRKTLDKYLSTTSGDSILIKLKHSKNLILSSLEFQGKYSGESLIEHTHVIVVYNGKNTKPVANSKMGYVSKQKVSRGANGKQNRANSLSFIFNDKDSKFGIEVKKLGYVSCCEDNFPVPAKPPVEKLKGVGKVRNFSIFSAQDFKKLVSFNYFQNWDWGNYSKYIDYNLIKK